MVPYSAFITPSGYINLVTPVPAKAVPFISVNVFGNVTDVKFEQFAKVHDFNFEIEPKLVIVVKFGREF